MAILLFDCHNGMCRYDISKHIKKAAIYDFLP